MIQQFYEYIMQYKIIIILACVLLYAAFAYGMVKYIKATNHKFSWFGWIPILNIIWVVKCSNQKDWKVLDTNLPRYLFAFIWIFAIPFFIPFCIRHELILFISYAFYTLFATTLITNIYEDITDTIGSQKWLAFLSAICPLILLIKLLLIHLEHQPTHSAVKYGNDEYITDDVMHDDYEDNFSENDFNDVQYYQNEALSNELEDKEIYFDDID